MTHPPLYQPEISSTLHHTNSQPKPHHYATMHIKPDDLSSPAIRTLLSLHFSDLQSKSKNPSSYCHVLDLTALHHDSITVYSAWDGDTLLGCGALKQLSPSAGEIKSMRTAMAHLRKGVGRAIVQHIIAEAKGRGYVSLSLETGTDGSFERAREFYRGLGFRDCGPFGGYVASEENCFMRLMLG